MKRLSKYNVPLKRALAKLAGAEAREVETIAVRSKSGWNFGSRKDLELTPLQRQTRGQTCASDIRDRPVSLKGGGD